MLQLADGRAIHLAEVFIPPQVEARGFPSTQTAAHYLQSNVLGRKVEVRFGDNRRDRYGGTIAHIFVSGEPALWLEEDLVRAGLAKVFPQPDNYACTLQLAAAEETARRENRGAWGLALFQVLNARDPRSMLNLMQTYQIVEGEIRSVTLAGARTILHFAGDSKIAFTAVIEPSAQRRLSAKAPNDWQGLKVRVRGWLERKRGPTISIIQPEQIEILTPLPAIPASEE